MVPKYEMSDINAFTHLKLHEYFDITEHLRYAHLSWTESNCKVMVGQNSKFEHYLT